MIESHAYDVEILPNFFSVAIVNLNSYLKVFTNACEVNDKGKKRVIPLVQKYKVAEIKKLLTTVERKVFYITDTDDSQLLPMLGYINSLRPHYNSKGTPVRSDLFGYNSSKYDRLMIAGLLMFANQVHNTKELITKLYELSKHIIEIQDNKELRKNDYMLGALNKFALPYTDIDVMTIFALNKVGKGVDAKTGEVIYFPKSLKQTSINLQWYELLEHELPPISDKDAHFYEKNPKYKGIAVDKLNMLIDKWDRYMLDEWIEDVLHYNLNDVFIVCEMVRLYIDEVKLRYNISRAYKVNVLSSSRSNIADRLFEKFYSDFSGLSPREWQGKKTDRTSMAFKRVIFDFIDFKTPELKELLAELKQVVVHSIGKNALKEVADKMPHLKYLKSDNKSGWFEVKLNKLVYTIATGGLHSQDVPRELKSKIVIDGSPSTGETASEASDIWRRMTDDSYVYVHADVSDAA